MARIYLFGLSALFLFEICDEDGKGSFGRGPGLQAMDRLNSEFNSPLVNPLSLYILRLSLRIWRERERG